MSLELDIGPLLRRPLIPVPHHLGSSSAYRRSRSRSDYAESAAAATGSGPPPPPPKVVRLLEHSRGFATGVSRLASPADVLEALGTLAKIGARLYLRTADRLSRPGNGPVREPRRALSTGTPEMNSCV